MLHEKSLSVVRLRKKVFFFLFVFFLLSFCSLKDERWRSAFDPKLAGLLSELELGLGSVVRQSGTQPSAKKGCTEEDVLGMRTYCLQSIF